MKPPSLSLCCTVTAAIVVTAATAVATAVRETGQRHSESHGFPGGRNVGRPSTTTDNKPGRPPCDCERTAVDKSNDRKVYRRLNHPIPLTVIMELNRVTNVEELIKMFTPHFNNYNVLMRETTNSTLVPKAASCTTEMHTVSLVDDDDPSLYFSPPCTRVKRCGGCCGSNSLSCQPTEVEMLDFQVTVLQYNGTFTLKEKKIVTVEQHVKCKCDCTVKEQDCKPSQVYNANECRCICNNLEDQEECDGQQETRMWDQDTCSCRCIEERECTTGHKFNLNICQCEPEAM